MAFSHGAWDDPAVRLLLVVALVALLTELAELAVAVVVPLPRDWLSSEVLLELMLFWLALLAFRRLCCWLCWIGFVGRTKNCLTPTI